MSAPRRAASRDVEAKLSRPRALLFAATHVVKACVELTEAQKLVWLEHFALDNSPDGCWQGAGAMARRLGLNKNTIEAHRRWFVTAGLLVRESRGSGYTDKWFPALPPVCVPRSQRLTEDQVSVLAERLDLHLRRLNAPQSGVPPYATQPSEDVSKLVAIRHSGVSPSASNPAGLGTERRTTIRTESMTAGEAGEVGEAGEAGEMQSQKKVSGEKARDAAIFDDAPADDPPAEWVRDWTDAPLDEEPPPEEDEP